jgi:hypothetical protein
MRASIYFVQVVINEAHLNGIEDCRSAQAVAASAKVGVKVA